MSASSPCHNRTDPDTLHTDPDTLTQGPGRSMQHQCQATRTRLLLRSNRFATRPRREEVPGEQIGGTVRTEFTGEANVPGLVTATGVTVERAQGLRSGPSRRTRRRGPRRLYGSGPLLEIRPRSREPWNAPVPCQRGCASVPGGPRARSPGSIGRAPPAWLRTRARHRPRRTVSRAPARSPSAGRASVGPPG